MTNTSNLKVMPGGKTLGDGEIDNHQHQAVLDWLWENVEAQSAFICKSQDEELESMQAKALAEHYARLKNFIHDMTVVVDDPAYADEREVIMANIARATVLLDTPMPSPGPEVQLPSLQKRVYQHQITEQRPVSGSQARTVVCGFVDVAVTMLRAVTLKIDCVPYYPKHLKHVPKDFVARLELKSPRWTIGDTKAKDVWFDVRVKLPTTGQIVRELRELRRHAGDAATICVVATEVPPAVTEVLLQSGFGVLEGGPRSE